VLTSRFFTVVALPLAVLSGCAALPSDRGIGDVRGLVTDRSGQVLPAPDADTKKLVADLLAMPLTADSVVQVALINNPRIRVEYARLGLAAAEIYNAGRLSNPRFSADVLFSNEAGTANQVTFGLAQSFTDLLLLSASSRFAKGQFERAKQEAGAAIMDLSADVEVAHYELIGARQVAAMRGTVAKAAQVSAELAQRFFDAGNINALELVQEQSAASQARLSTLQAEAAVVGARNALNRLMGLRANDGRWETSNQLPLPLAEEDNFDTLLQLARQSRLDLAAKRAEVELLADSLGVNRRTRYIGSIEVGVETERETDRSRISGPNLSIELPIFNRGAGKVARAVALVDQAEAELQSLALEVGNDVQLAHAQVLAARALTEQFRSALIPQREAVVRYTQEEVNYMFKGQFELLLAKQQEYDAYQGYLEALRDYWIARADLARTVGARLPSQSQVGSKTVGPTVLPDTPPPGMQHMNHGAGGMEGMDTKGMEHAAPSADPAADPTAVKAACENIRNAEVSDPLTQALAQKCGEQKPAIKPPAKDAAEPPPHEQHSH